MSKQITKLFLMLVLLGFSGNIWAQQMIVKGKVSDAATGEGLPGSTIQVKGTTLGTITDLDGKFQIQVNSGNDILVVSFIGYLPMEVKVGTQTEFDVKLSVISEEIEEVVVIGYGVQKKTDKTGAVSNIQADELNGGVLTDPIQAMQGKAAGVVITKKGGDPNGGFSVKIRGASGLASGTNPLYVVDGVPGVDPTTIAPEDIESFNILKDASSTAIYGSRGANGVIIITTKRGQNTGAIVNFNAYTSLDQVAKRLDLMDADQIRAYATENNLNLIDGGANTDWQDAIYRNGITQNYNLAISGGSENTTVRSSVTFSDFMGVVIGTEKQRTIARINLTQKALNNKLTVQTNLAGTFEKNDYISYGSNGTNDIFYQAFQRNPTDPIYDEDGEFYEVQRDFNYYNPVALVEQIQNERDAKRFFGNLKADLELFSGFILGVNYGYVRNDDESFYFEPSFVRGGNSLGYGKRAYNSFSSSVFEGTASYTKSFGENFINAIAGYSFQEDFSDGLWAQGSQPLSDFVLSHNLGVLNVVNVGDIGSYKNSNRLISFFGRATYNFGSRYYVTGTIRRDGSSKFGANKEWGIFPSGSVAWNIKNESFLENVDFVSSLKFRVGYGLSGNQEIASYLDTRYVSPAGTAPNPETGEDAINFEASHNTNPDLQWEENAELNIGIDFGFAKDKISGSIEYYDKSTYNLLAEYSVPVPPNALARTYANVGDISNKGVELNIQAYIIARPNLDWKTGFTFSHNKMMVNSLSNDEFEWSPMKEGWLSGRGLVGDQNWTQIVGEGYEIGTFYMPEYAGLSSDGKFLYYTAAGGVTRDLAAAERRVVGNALPDFVMGWSNYFTFFKKFDFRFSLRGVYGSDVLNVTRLMFGNPIWLPNINVLESALEEIENGLDDYPRPSSYYLEDGSFIRLDEVTLGYSIPTEKIGFIQKFRVYFSSNNVFTLTKYTGIDPEVAYDGLSFGLDQYNVYPKTKTFTFGVNMTF